MEKHLQKINRLFPSSLTSCHFRSIPKDIVAESSIIISKKINHFQNDSFKETQQPNKNLKYPKHINKYKRPLSNEKEKKTSNKSHSSSANSGWFSSTDEKNDTFVSFSSNSGDSFRLKTSQRFRKYEEMKKIDETGRCSLSSVPSFHTLGTKSSPPEKNTSKKNRRSMTKCSKVFPDYKLGPDHISTQIYYSKNVRKKTKKRRRKVVKKKNTAMVIEESYAVEKSSKDPYGDFRASMVEMIVEKQMFGAEDLERLLQCFLSLNAVAYHEIILNVFSEICETLFSN